MPKNKVHSDPEKPVEESHLWPKGTTDPFEPEKFTIGDILKVLSRLTVKQVIGYSTTIVIFLFAVFSFGYLIALKYYGIELNHPFDMRISVTEKDLIQNGNDSADYMLPKLTLVKSPIAKDEDKKCYIIFREVEPLSDRRVGQVECLVSKASLSEILKERLLGLSNTISGSFAFAQDFSLGAHSNDNNYTQSFVAANTVQRTYADGCILQYKIDANGISIPTSYKWIVYKH